MSECGSVPSANTLATNSVDSPAQFFVGEPVNGQLEPGSATDSSNFWQIELDAGNYHLVVDTWDMAEGESTLGIEVTSLGDVAADDEQFLADSDAAVDLRSYEYLEIRDPRLLTLRTEAPSFRQIHNYTMGIFRNGNAVPSPSFNRCLPQNELALNTTQSLTLAPAFSREDDVWYQLELGSGAFTLDASASALQQSAIGYSFTAFNGFGENVTAEVLSRDSEAGTLLTTSDVFENSFDGTVWIRVRNSFRAGASDLDVEFTLSDL